MDYVKASRKHVENMAYKFQKWQTFEEYPSNMKGQRQQQTGKWSYILVQMQQVEIQWRVHWRVSQNFRESCKEHIKAPSPIYDH